MNTARTWKLSPMQSSNGLTAANMPNASPPVVRAGIVSNLGQEPVARGEACEFLVTGPMSRHASDLAPMLRVMAAANVHRLKLDEKVGRGIGHSNCWKRRWIFNSNGVLQ